MRWKLRRKVFQFFFLLLNILSLRDTIAILLVIYLAVSSFSVVGVFNCAVYWILWLKKSKILFLTNYVMIQNELIRIQKYLFLVLTMLSVAWQKRLRRKWIRSKTRKDVLPRRIQDTHLFRFWYQNPTEKMIIWMRASKFVTRPVIWCLFSSRMRCATNEVMNWNGRNIHR